ncbi:ABC transporter substrate-binding protein [Marinomonas sp. 15G1-11]|uniref:ABC transporter substrate-binding protein n=1 Tax=Marinomonas phaeophyticola TaxID=3004091 RepID=A0ABT4JPT7_9GAMM|nr:ABC transporter substrate-binding protein [Marinomonas sp. 15G1-11]MCZ2720402.1 ABC transporter substrate-binding protein [Marinomonas sp. 15G1-11]
MITLLHITRRLGLLSLLGFLVTYSSWSFSLPNPSNTLSISAAFEFTSLDPSKNGYIYTRMQVVESLFNVDGKGSITQGLANNWQVSSDGKVWTINLREDVLFHDGSVMDSATVLKSLSIAQQKHGALKKSPVEAIKAIDTHTIEITLSRAYNLLPAVLAHYSSAILSSESYDDNGEVLTLSGTGPYQVYTYLPPHKLVVEKFDGYWGKQGSIPYVSYLTGHRAESRVLQARSGQADIVFGLDPASLPSLKRLPNLTVYSNAIPRTIVLKLNSGHPFLKDVKARQALSLAINRAGISNAILRTPGSETDQLMPPSMGDWYLSDVEKTTYQLVKAKEILASLGWEMNRNGVLEKDGEPFEMTLITYADRPELTTVATAIQAQWAELGVSLKVDVTNSSAIPMGHKNGTLEMALIARNYGFIANPLGVVLADFGENGGGDWGAMNWYSQDISADLKRLEQINDTAQYHQLTQKNARVIFDEKPMIPVSYYIQQTAVNKRVKGFYFDPYERSFYLNNMEFIKQ